MHLFLQAKQQKDDFWLKKPGCDTTIKRQSSNDIVMHKGYWHFHYQLYFHKSFELTSMCLFFLYLGSRRTCVKTRYMIMKCKSQKNVITDILRSTSGASCLICKWRWMSLMHTEVHVYANVSLELLSLINETVIPCEMCIYMSFQIN